VIDLNAVTGFVVMVLGILAFMGFVIWVEEKY